MLCSSICKDIRTVKQMPEEAVTGLHSGCKYASNPYHICSEYCLGFTPEPEKLVAKKDITASVQAEKIRVTRDCRHSLNPYHVCNEYCIEVISEPKKLAAKNEPASVQAEKTGVNRDCRHSSNPYHVCSEYCFEVNSEPKKLAAKNEPAGLKAETRSSQPTSISTATSVQAEKIGVNRDCRHSSNPYHVCNEYCSNVMSEPKKPTAKNEPAGLKAEATSSQPTSMSTATRVQAEKTGVNRECRHSSNPYHVCSEYCFEGTSESKKSTAKNEPAGLKAETRSSQTTSISTASTSVQAEKSGVNPDCRHSSNPYHVCSEYCFEGTSEPKKSTAKNEPAGMKAETRSSKPTSISTASTSVQAEKSGVNPDCRHSSNPYHVCSEYCFEGTSEPKKSTAKNEPARLKAETRSSKSTSTSTASTSVQAEKSGVNQDCRHSLNPYHVCSEYCFEATSEPKKSTTKSKPAGPKAETRTSISTATSVQAKKPGLNQDCKYSSNPYHVCSEFCFEVTAEPKKLAAAKHELGVGRRHFRGDVKSDDKGTLISV